MQNANGGHLLFSARFNNKVVTAPWQDKQFEVLKFSTSGGLGVEEVHHHADLV